LLTLLRPGGYIRGFPQVVAFYEAEGRFGQVAAMPVHSEQRGRLGNRRLARWLKAWREDRERHSSARAEARARAPIEAGERLLAVAHGTVGELAVATDRALYHENARSWARLGWEQVGQLRWDEQRHALTLTGLTPEAPARTVLRLASAWDLPAVASERVTWTRVVDQRVWLNGRAGARVVARRAPGQPSITWVVILDHGLDPGDRAVRAALEAALTDLRAVTGVWDAPAQRVRVPGW